MIYETGGQKHWKTHGTQYYPACAAVVIPRKNYEQKIIFHIFCNKNNEKYTSAINKDKLQHSDRKNLLQDVLRGQAELTLEVEG